jgi:hypothetical protein
VKVVKGQMSLKHGSGVHLSLDYRD